MQPPESPSPSKKLQFVGWPATRVMDVPAPEVQPTEGPVYAPTPQPARTPWERIKRVARHPATRLFLRMKSYVFTFVAVYVIYNAFTLLTESYTASLPFYKRQEEAVGDSTCVPLFTAATSLNASSSILYAYAQNTPLLRVCTDLTGPELDAALGANYRYDPLAAAAPGCAASPEGFAALAAACTYAKNVPSPPFAPNCSAAAAICAANATAGAPEASRCFYQYGIAVNPGSWGTPCAAQVFALLSGPQLTNPPPLCLKRFVWSLISVSSLKQTVTYVALAAMALRLLCEVAAAAFFCARGRRAPVKGDGFFQHLLWAFINGGLLGAPLEAYFWCATSAPPPAVHVSATVAFLVLLSDVASHVAIPAVAIYGCTARPGFALPIVQVAVQAVKAVVHCAEVTYAAHDDDVEPGKGVAEPLEEPPPNYPAYPRAP